VFARGRADRSGSETVVGIIVNDDADCRWQLPAAAESTPRPALTNDDTRRAATARQTHARTLAHARTHARTRARTDADAGDDDDATSGEEDCVRARTRDNIAAR